MEGKDRKERRGEKRRGMIVENTNKIGWDVVIHNEG